MPFEVRIGTAFRWRPTSLSGRASDVVRVVSDGGVTLALLANGFECGFSACWPPASRLVLDRFVEAWAATSGPTHEGSIEARLEAAFVASRRAFVAEAPALLAPDADFPDDRPDAVLLAVAIAGTSVHARWIGGDVAALTRGGRTVAASAPHTLIERFAREHPELDPAHVPNVLVRSLGERDEAPADALAFDVAPGDVLLLLSRAAFRGPCVPLDEAARLALEEASPTTLAERLAERAFEADVPYAAVVALRFEAVRARGA